MFKKSESIRHTRAPLVAALAAVLLLTAVPCVAAGPGVPGHALNADTTPVWSWSVHLVQPFRDLMAWVTAAWDAIGSDVDPDGTAGSAASSAPAAVTPVAGTFGLREVRSSRLAG